MAQQTEPQTANNLPARPSDSLIQYLIKRATEESVNRAYEVAASQIDAMMQAQTEEEFWAATDWESIGGRDLEDVEQQVNSFSIHRSDKFTSGIPTGEGDYFYAFVQAQRMDDGREFTWNTGAALLIGQLRWLEAKGKFPAQIVIRGTDAGGGKTVLKFRPVPKRAVKGQTA